MKSGAGFGDPHTERAENENILQRNNSDLLKKIQQEQDENQHLGSSNMQLQKQQQELAGSQAQPPVGRDGPSPGSSSSSSSSSLPNVQKKKSVVAGKAAGGGKTKTKKKGRKKKMQDLFEALSSKASPKILADNLLSKYGTAEGENIVVVQLLNLIFRCSGMENNGLTQDTNVSQLTNEGGYNIAEHLQVGGGLLAKLQKEASSTSYPAAEKNAQTRSLSKRLDDFWSKLVHACCSGTTPDVSTEGGLLDVICGQIEVIAHSAGHPFRHASVQAMTGIVNALGVKIGHVDDQLVQVRQKMESEVRKAKTKKASVSI